MPFSGHRQEDGPRTGAEHRAVWMRLHPGEQGPKQPTRRGGEPHGGRFATGEDQRIEGVGHVLCGAQRMNGDRLVQLRRGDLEGLAMFVTGPLDHRQTDVQHDLAEPGCPQEHDR